MKLSRLRLFLVHMPQKPPVAPYRSRGNSPGSTFTRSLIVRLESDNGLVGWGETWAGVSPADLEPTATAWSEQLQGRDPFDLERILAECAFGGLGLTSAVEMALWDLMGKAAGRPVCMLLGGLYRQRVELAACMGIRSYQEAGSIARQYVEMGFTTLKTKAGDDPDEDFEMVRGIRDAVGDALHLRIDANQGYSPEVALELCKRLEPYGLQYFEQPCPREALEGIAQLRRQTSVPIALNESIGPPETIPPILKAGAADVLMPDFPQCGGIWQVKKVAALAEAASLTCVMHCGHDLGIKTAAMLHVAASTPCFRLGNDTTYYSMESDITREPFEIEGGHIRVPLKPGLGADADEAKLARYAAGA